MNYKKAFYSKLEDCYLGVKIKDFHENNTTKSGFSNLLKIKEQYFAHIKSYLDREIENTPQSHDIYNKLFTFFDSYLGESGTPFFTDTPIYKNIYAKVYSNTKDTSLFYKTQNLYYVKSDTLYQSLTLSDDNETFQVYFDAKQYRQNADNSKTKLLFKLHSIDTKEGELPTIAIKVLSQKDLFPDLNNVFKQNSNEFSEDFSKALKDSKLKINEEDLKKIFRSYKKQSEIDFFIHKNSKGFLQEQFDLWMFSYLYKDSEIQEWNPDKIANLQRIKNIAYEIISLIADFENELKAIWLKPKFAKKVEYVFSIETIMQNTNNANTLLDSIINDKGFESQIKEWQELHLIDESFGGKDFILSLRGKAEAIHNAASHRDSNNIEFYNDDKCNKYRYLPIDTKHFTKETKYKILSSFDNLESLLNGELIKSDNFQALNTLMPKYGGKVDLIYIDPPYNTGNDGFIYADTFNHASWLSLMNNRLECARELLNLKGSMFISIDDKEQARLKLLCDEVFGEENFVSNIIYEKVKIRKNSAQYFSESHEHILNYGKEKELWQRNLLPRKDLSGYKNPDNDPRGVWIPIPIHANHYYEANYTITKPNGVVLEKPKNQSWRLSEENFKKHVQENRIWWGNSDSYPMIKRFLSEVQDGLVPRTIFYYDETGGNPAGDKALKDNFDDTKVFENPKPEGLLQQILNIASGKDSVVLDFFAGSGTTLAVAQKLGRKWIGVEMGEHFYNVIIPRLKKVIAGFQSGISKECNYKGGGAFRYYELETYEEALNHCEYILQPLSANAVENKSDYKGKDYAKCGAILDYRKSRKLIDKLNKGEIVSLDMRTESRKDFDIFHTLANLMGWKIKRLFLDSKGTESCEFDNREIVSKDCLDLHKCPKLKNLIWWE